MSNNEVCIFVDTKLGLPIDYKQNTITMGDKFQYSKVLDSTNDHSIDRMKKFISFQRIQEFHERTKGSCICINGTSEKHQRIFFDLVDQYLRSLQNEAIKVSVIIQGKDQVPYQLAQEQQTFTKVRLSDGIESRSRSIRNTDYFVSHITQFNSCIEEIHQQLSFDSLLNVNIRIQIYSIFQVKRTYSLILVQNHFDLLLKFWTGSLTSNQTVIFQNTYEQQKTIVSFLKDQKQKELRHYFKLLQFMQDKDLLDDSENSYICSNSTAMQNQRNQLNQGSQNLGQFQIQDEQKNSSQLEQPKEILRSINKNQIQRQNCQNMPLIEIQQSNQILYLRQNNQPEYNQRQMNINTEQQDLVQSPIELSLNQQRKSEQRISSPIQKQSQSSPVVHYQIQNSNLKLSQSQRRRKVMEKVYEFTKVEPENQFLMIQVLKDPVRVETLSDLARKKFQIAKTDVNLRFNIQLVNGVFDDKQTNILLLKGNWKSVEQYKKLENLLEECMKSNFNYFQIIIGKPPKDLFLYNTKKNKQLKQAI